MAFCSNCGAQISGAFCGNCGTPVRAAGAPAPIPAAASAAGVPPAPVRRTSPLVWVLVVILGLFVLGGAATVGTGLFIAHKVRQAGLDPGLMRRNPGYAVAKMFLGAHPDLEEVSHDDNAGSITVRDRHTGKETTLNFNDIQNGRFHITAEGDNGETATLDFGGGAAKLPAWVPAYPGSNGKATFSATGTDNQGAKEGGTFAFSTPDSPAQVLSFYQDKARDAGMKVTVNTTTPQGGMFTAEDEGSHRSLVVVVGRSGPDTTVSVTYGLKE